MQNLERVRVTAALQDDITKIQRTQRKHSRARRKQSHPDAG